MSTSARDIRIVPDRGVSTQPVMFFTGADSLSSATIVLRVLNSSTDATLSFEGDVGQLFSITDSTFGPVFSVNDISGIPSIEVLDSGLIKLAEYNGLVRIGSAVNNENATSTSTGELQVVGGVGISRDAFVGGNMTVAGTLNAAVIAGSITNSANVGVTNDNASSTAQYLTFVSGTSGNLPIKVDASALTFIPSTNNLGIGTTTPYSRLSLVSSANTEGISLFTSAYEAGRQWGHRIWKNDVGGGIPLQIDAQETTTWYTTVRMSHGQNNNHPALITYFNTQLAMTSGNVGVGITPTNKLHVSGDSKFAGSLVGLRNYQSGDDFRMDFVKADNDTASARFEWNGYSSQTSHLIDYFSIGLNDASSAMQTRFQIMQDGRIGLNTTDFSYASSDNTAVVAGGIDANRVFVNGSIQLIGNNNAIVFGRGTSSFLKDEELGFGWGGGWHMTDATYLRSRNNKHVYNEAPFSGSRFTGFSTSYNQPNMFMPRWNDTNWAFGSESNDSNVYWMQVQYSGDGSLNRGFRVKNANGGAILMAVNDRITTHPNTFYRTWQNYAGSDNGPMKTWDGVLVAGSDNSGAQAVTVIDTTVPQDSYMMGGFSIEWFENYFSTNGKTSITLSGYWNAQSNGGFIGWEYTSSNPNIVPTIRIARNVSTGNTSFILSHFNSNYAIVLARDLWLGYSSGDATYGSGWTIKQQADTTGYTNIVSVTARTAMPAGSGSGSGLNADLLDGIDSSQFVRDDAVSNGYIHIDGGTQNAPSDGTVFITATNNNDWGLIVNKFNGGATEYGIDVRVGNAAAYAFRVNGNGTEKMRINGEGQIFSPLYYDYNNSGYYLDPTSTTALRTVGSWRADSSAWDGDFSGKIQYHSNHWYIQAADLFIYRNAGGSNVFTVNQSGSAIASADMRAPIFYDTNNTSYYLDPTSTQSLRTVGDWRSDSAGWTGEFSGKIQYHNSSWYLQGANQLIFRNSGGSDVFTVNQSGEIRAPIFYDSNDTNYYLDPAGTSRLNIINANTFNASGGAIVLPQNPVGQGYAGVAAQPTYYIGQASGNDDAWKIYSESPSGTNTGALILQSEDDFDGNESIRLRFKRTYGAFNTTDSLIAYFNYVYAVDMRAPIFYDNNDTNFYVDPNGTSRLATLNITSGFNTRSSDVYADMRVIRSGGSDGMYIGYANSSGGVTRLYGGGSTGGEFIKYSTYSEEAGSFRAPIFYDSNNTGFYLDPNGTSELNRINTVRANNFLYLDNNFGHSIVGVYSASRYQGVFAMGDAYKLPADGTSPSNLYGIAWSHPNAGGVAGNLNTHGALIMENGTFLAALSGSVRARDDMRAPIFYDSNNTGFYVDPNGTSNLNVLNVGTLNISGTIPTNTSYLRRMSDRDFGSGTLVQTNINYAVTNGDPFVIEITGNSYGQIVPWDIQIQGYIYADTIINTAGISNGTNISGIRAINFNGNLCFWWPRQSYWNGFTVYVYVPYSTFQTNRVTSITDSGQPTTAKQVVFTVYQNYSNYNSTSFDATFNRLYSNTDVRAPIYYDSNDTGYYADFNSTSNSAMRVRGGTLYGPNPTWGEYLQVGGNGDNGTYAQVVTTNGNLHLDGRRGGYGIYLQWYAGGPVYVENRIDATIFYDRNDTSYYTDPNSTTRLYNLTMQNVISFPTSSGASSSRGGPAYNIYQESGGWNFPFPDLNIAFHTGLSFGANPSYEGMRFFTDYDLSSRVMQVNGPSNYIYMDRWVNVAGNQGIYSGTNSAHFYPNNGDYGSWRIDGTRNGWHGIYFSSGSTLMMNDGEGGIHRSGNGWRIYHSGNDLYARGEITAYWSDRRLKQNIKPLEKGSGLALVDKLVPSSFEWNELATKVNDGFYEGQPETALIAQEVQEILPIAVAENKAGRKAGKDSSIESYLTVKYDKITPFLIQAIKDLKAEIEELREIIRNGSN